MNTSIKFWHAKRKYRDIKAILFNDYSQGVRSNGTAWEECCPKLCNSGIHQWSKGKFKQEKKNTLHSLQVQVAMNKKDFEAE